LVVVDVAACSNSLFSFLFLLDYLSLCFACAFMCVRVNGMQKHRALAMQDQIRTLSDATAVGERGGGSHNLSLIFFLIEAVVVFADLFSPPALVVCVCVLFSLVLELYIYNFFFLIESWLCLLIAWLISLTLSLLLLCVGPIVRDGGKRTGLSLSLSPVGRSGRVCVCVCVCV
jgi:hypothetical protein